MTATSCHLQNLKSKGNFGAFGLAAIKLDKIRYYFHKIQRFGESFDVFYHQVNYFLVQIIVNFSIDDCDILSPAKS